MLICMIFFSKKTSLTLIHISDKQLFLTKLKQTFQDPISNMYPNIIAFILFNIIQCHQFDGKKIHYRICFY